MITGGAPIAGNLHMTKLYYSDIVIYHSDWSVTNNDQNPSHGQMMSNVSTREGFKVTLSPKPSRMSQACLLFIFHPRLHKFRSWIHEFVRLTCAKGKSITWQAPKLACFVLERVDCRSTARQNGKTRCSKLRYSKLRYSKLVTHWDAEILKNTEKWEKCQLRQPVPLPQQWANRWPTGQNTWYREADQEEMTGSVLSPRLDSKAVEACSQTRVRDQVRAMWTFPQIVSDENNRNVTVKQQKASWNCTKPLKLWSLLSLWSLT